MPDAPRLRRRQTSMKSMRFPAALAALVFAATCTSNDDDDDPGTTPTAQPGENCPPADTPVTRPGFDGTIDQNAQTLIEEGRKIFRYDTFGSEDFWGGQLHLHEAIAGTAGGAQTPGRALHAKDHGLTPRMALGLGLKVDKDALPEAVIEAIKGGSVDLDAVDTTMTLLKANAVIGLTGFFGEDGKLNSIGIQCAFCHSTVDDSVTTGIGSRLDGWPNRDLDVGKIVAMAPTLEPFANLLGVPESTVRQVLTSWGPGKYDAELNQDGKALRPDGQTAATVLPAAFGLAGVNLHTYTGWGSVTYWNAYVANTQMYGKGTFYDPRLNDAERFPVAQRAGWFNKRDSQDLITSKLAALHFYQLAIPAPTPPAGSFDKTMADRGKLVFEGKARCATCHVPPIYTEPGFGMHSGQEIGIDDFQASRSPERMYRTTPLKGLFTRMKGGFYHDGRFADLEAVVRHYEPVLEIGLSDGERRDLIEYLKSL
jgi:hypothetical protein